MISAIHCYDNWYFFGQDLCKEIKQLGAFLNAPLSDEKTQDIAKACTFDAMRKDMTESKGPDSQVATQLMRKG